MGNKEQSSVCTGPAALSTHTAATKHGSSTDLDRHLDPADMETNETAQLERTHKPGYKASDTSSLPPVPRSSEVYELQHLQSSPTSRHERSATPQGSRHNSSSRSSSQTCVRTCPPQSTPAHPTRAFLRRPFRFSHNSSSAHSPHPEPEPVRDCQERADGKERKKWFGGLRHWWCNHISLVVPANGRRDHLALERTFLGYFRTSLAMCMFSVVVAQLMRLQRPITPDPKFGYYKLSSPLAAAGLVTAIVINLCGACRFLRQQSAIARGKAYAGGWELFGVGGIVGLYLIVIFGLFVAVNVHKTVNYG